MLHGTALKTAALVVCVAAGTGSTGCGDDEDAGTVSVLFEHEVGGQPLVLDGDSYTNAAGNVFTVSHLEYIVTDVDLVSRKGSTRRLADAHYRDAARPETAGFDAAAVPGGDYVALAFTFGVAAAGNTFGALPNAAHYNNMEWPAMMGGGYHYMRLEGYYDGGGQTAAFLSHTGPAGGADYSIRVELPVDLTVDADGVEITVFMDVNEWFEGPTIYDFSGRGMIMGNADAQLTHQANGATVFRAVASRS